MSNLIFTALSVQAGYAATNGLNLLAAGLSDVQNATTGSGIHYFNGTSVSQISSVTTDRSLYGLVPSLTSKSFSVCSEVSFYVWKLSTFYMNDKVKLDISSILSFL